MATKITKVRIGSTVYEKEADSGSSETEGEAFPAPEPTPSPEPTFLEKAVEAVEEVVKPKSRRGRPKKSSSSD